MTRKRFVVLVSVITCAVIAALGVAQMVPRSVRTFTATVSEEHYAAGSTVPWFKFTDTVAVRKDGSHVNARHVTSPADGKTVYRLSITDIPSRRTVVVDPLSESLSTRPLQQKSVDRLEIKATSSCPGQPAGKLLGFNVNLEETHKTYPGTPTFTRHVRTWASPDQDCFPLRQETHSVSDDGNEDFAVRSVSLLTQGDPPAWLFAIPTEYVERAPTEMFAEQARRYPQRYSQPDPSTHALDEVYNAAQKPK
jgi:hypothetical protein